MLGVHYHRIVKAYTHVSLRFYVLHFSIYDRNKFLTEVVNPLEASWRVLRALAGLAPRCALFFPYSLFVYFIGHYNKQY